MLGANAFSERLWIILEQTGGSEQELRRILSAKPKVVIAAFDREFRRASDNLREIEVPDESEDALKELYAMVVSKGKGFYDHIVNHPERILLDTNPGDPCYFGTAWSVYWDVFGEEMPGYG